MFVDQEGWLKYVYAGSASLFRLVALIIVLLMFLAICARQDLHRGVLGRIVIVLVGLGALICVGGFVLQFMVQGFGLDEVLALFSVIAVGFMVRHRPVWELLLATIFTLTPTLMHLILHRMLREEFDKMHGMHTAHQVILATVAIVSCVAASR